MKSWHIIAYAFVGAFFTAGIIFSITSTFTNDRPFSFIAIFLIMGALVLFFVLFIFSYQKHRPSLKDMENQDGE
ncbi:hypothetical protein [Phocicoccus pinnipedialis]|uniref:Uncharacterized protein n=1 Tax=Phocicoccus pinnipedialis TaxID=110845 RepID=A0A6V7R416_9BACL|nr:hypothetical protein [Jeotgalicoccus pinnipedialis]MBP1939962.1 Ca2+/Na+ antiporter [Jeotgalicoccus pinnipedialis]CAD2072090.1 hypothetical protein JEOPIN946_00288 [Jeotgalicoccus pinnipedialis]